MVSKVKTCLAIIFAQIYIAPYRKLAKAPKSKIENNYKEYLAIAAEKRNQIVQKHGARSFGNQSLFYTVINVSFWVVEKINFCSARSTVPQYKIYVNFASITLPLLLMSV